MGERSSGGSWGVKVLAEFQQFAVLMIQVSNALAGRYKRMRKTFSDIQNGCKFAQKGSACI